MPGTSRNWFMVIALAALAALAPVVWVLGLFVVAQYSEDVCFDDLAEHPDHGAYRAVFEIWPPSYECQLLSNRAEPIVVQHRFVAAARVAALFVVPIAYVAAVTLGVVFWIWRRRQK